MPENKTDTRSPEQTGAEGGHQRAENLSPGRRHEIAVDAANARWAEGGDKSEKATPDPVSKE